MKIKIRYSSKWSNSFSDPITKKNNAVSLGAIQESIKGKKVTINENDSYEEIMKKINDVHPNFQYNAITQNTVLGVVSRLLGEIRYLNNFIEVEKEHIINKLKDKISFTLEDQNMFNEIVRLSTPEKEVQSNGAGVIGEKAKNNILLTKNEYSELFYSVFNIVDLDTLKEFIEVLKNSKKLEDLKYFFVKKDLLYKENFELHKFIELYNKNVKQTESLDKEYRNMLSGKIEINSDIVDYIEVIKEIGKLNHNDENFHLKPKFINMAGVLVYLVSNFLLRNQYEIKGVLVESKGNIKGIAEASGGLTIKDFYNAFASKKTSSDSPYFLKSKFFNKKENKKINQGDFSLGITKEDGILNINIDVDEEEAVELKNIINAVGVSTFQLGKKGLAYVERIETYE